ncbi:phage tail tape measure protein [Paenibacillus larvae]|nr:phage tail tape measure protein [Paenibacillus larvae]MDT2266372.1 phage tail tape measure protein [Paenibacillus larvae]
MAGLMKKTGMEFFDAQGKMKSMPELVAEIEKGIKGMTEQQRSAALSILFGAEAYKRTGQFSSTLVPENSRI